MWLQDEYIYRRKIQLYSEVDVPAGHPVRVQFKMDLFESGKVRSDFEDMEIVYLTDDATPVNVVLYREVEQDGNDIFVTFNLYDDLVAKETIDSRYYLYHGNLGLISPPSREGLYVIEEWPITTDYDDGLIAYTRPGEHWVDGKSSEPNSRATFLFYGTQLRILSDIGFYGAIMEVQIDNGDWEQVDLFSRIEETDQEVYRTEDLDNTVRHEIRVRVPGESNPSSLGDEVNIKSIEYRKSVVTADLGEELNSLTWSSFVGGV